MPHIFYKIESQKNKFPIIGNNVICKLFQLRCHIGIKVLALIFFALIIIPLSIFPQSPVKVLEIPWKYKVPTEFASVEKSDSRVSGSYWIVYSDRSDNVTYTSPQSSEIKKHLEYLDNFYVIEENSFQIHLVKDKDLNINGNLSANYSDYGWINKDNMLLWNQCLLTTKAKVTKKAMILNTISSIKKIKEDKRSNFVKFYLNPELTQLSNYESNLFEVFFVFKKNANSTLLGRSSRITNSKYVKDDIIGWVPNERLNFWDHRIAVEPNSNEEAVKERKGKSISAKIFSDLRSAEQYKKTSVYDATKLLWDFDPFENRNIGDWRRFPILKENDDNILNIGVMGQINGKQGGVINQTEQANIQHNYNTERKKRRNINIVFIIDGSKSIQPFYKSICKALDNSIKQLYYSKNNIKFGSVIYRDFAEGDNVIEKQGLTSKYQDVSFFIENSYSDEKNKNDKDIPEAMYLGIYNGLRMLPDGETNIIILVGDAGNHNRQDESQVDKGKLIKLINDKNVHLLAYQVVNHGGIDYDNFITQIKNITILAAREKSTDINNYSKIAKVKFIPPEFKKRINNTWYLSNSPLISVVVGSSSGSAMQNKRLQVEIEEVVKYASDYTDKILIMMDQVIMKGGDVSGNIDTTGNKFVNSFSPAVLQYLKEINIPDNLIEVVCDERYQFYMEGFTPQKISGCKYSLFQSVLFLTRLELGGLLAKFNSLVDAVNSNDQRVKMQEAWIELLKQHLGNMSSEEIMEMSMDDINEKVFDLPSTSPILKNIRLKDIADIAVVDDRTFQRYVSQIETKKNRLDHIYNADNYAYSFKSNDEVYYWIEQDLLP